MSQVPKVTPIGAEGTQEVGTAMAPAVIAPPMQAASVTDAIDGLIATHSRNLGGDVSARLIAASMRETSNQLAAAHERITSQVAELKAAGITIADLRVENASLRAGLNETIGTNRLKQVATFVGTALLGLAVDLYKNGLFIAASLLGLLGGGLLAFTALPNREGKK